MTLKQQIVDIETGEVRSSRNLGNNSNFVMLFRNEIPALRAVAIEDGKALAIFMLITEHMGTDNCLIVSRETMSEILGISIPTIDRKIKFLKDKNFISVMRTGSSSIYTVNANVAWSTYGNKKDYAKFKASVLISRSEQEYKSKGHSTKQLDLLKPKTEEQ